MHIAVRAIFGLLTALFAYAAFLQLNDQDAAIWIAMYGTAAALCGLAAGNHPAPVNFQGGVIFIALCWAGYITTSFGSGTLTPMYPEGQMTGNLFVDTEEGREAAGLVIVSAALGLLAVIQIYARIHSPIRGRVKKRR